MARTPKHPTPYTYHLPLVSNFPADQFQGGLRCPITDALPIAGETEFTHRGALLIGHGNEHHANWFLRASATWPSHTRNAQAERGSGPPPDALRQGLSHKLGHRAVLLN